MPQCLHFDSTAYTDDEAAHHAHTLLTGGARNRYGGHVAAPFLAALSPRVTPGGRKRRYLDTGHLVGIAVN